MKRSSEKSRQNYGVSEMASSVGSHDGPPDLLYDDIYFPPSNLLYQNMVYLLSLAIK